MNVEVKNVTLKYKNFKALEDISFRLEDKKIYGLIGRNGAGKTSLLSLLASLREVSSGSISIAGEKPMENPNIMQQVTFVYETDYKDESVKVNQYMKLVGRYLPSYDPDYEKYLIERFKLPLNKQVNKLSKGMQSVLSVIIGLSSRSPITIFDEAYLGMDAPTRMIFYQELLAEQEKHPRIFILSTHLVSEMDYLFDEVMILHKGKLLMMEDYETLISKGVTIFGSSIEVDEFVKGKKIIGQQKLGNTKAVTLFGDKNDGLVNEAAKRGLEATHISLQDLFIHLTDEEVAQ